MLNENENYKPKLSSEFKFFLYEKLLHSELYKKLKSKNEKLVKKKNFFPDQRLDEYCKCEIILGKHIYTYVFHSAYSFLSLDRRHPQFQLRTESHKPSLSRRVSSNRAPEHIRLYLSLCVCGKCVQNVFDVWAAGWRGGILS